MRNVRLRRLLLALFFVVPLSVYHFSTFDPQARVHVRSAFPSLPQCLDVSSRDLLAADASQRLQTLCGVPNLTRKQAKITSKLRLVHFVHVAVDAVPLLPGEQEIDDKEQFTYLQFAALQSARRVLKPDMMMMHYLEAPRGVWYTQCQRHLGLHQVLPPVTFASGLSRHQRRRVIETLVMLRALKKHGGVAFSDFNTFLVRPTGVDMDEELVLAGQSHSKTFALGLHVMQAPAGHPFVEFLELKIVEMVETNDAKLQRMPLEEVVGHIVLEKYLEERNGASIMDGVAVGNSKLFGFDGLHELLTVKIGLSHAGKFRDVAGFHVDKYDFVEQTADTVDLRELSRMQKELTLAGEWQSLDTLFGAVVRLAVTANTSAELEPLFT